MHREPVVLATAILRNSAALMLVGLLAKGMGLVLAVLIARFLGPAAMGLFALLFSVALLVEYVAPLGVQDILVRDVAARPLERARLWKQGSRLAMGASLVPAVGFLVAAWAYYRDDETVRACLLALAVGMPVSALALVGQATLQGMEQALYLTWTTFITRVVSLVALVAMLMNGMGVEAAFISRVLFQAGSAAIFAWRILRHAPEESGAQTIGIGLGRSLPFAINRAVTEATTRAPLLLLPVLFALAEIGIFDAADRIRLTLGIMVGVATTAIMPAFARSFAGKHDDRNALVSFSLKYVCLSLAGAALVISVFADVIVQVLYGPKFARSGVLLQVLVWTQMLVATDSVLKQAMIANGREYAVVARALIGLACLAALVLGLGHAFGLSGAAAGVLASAAITLALDARFVVRAVLPFDVPRFLLKPLGCALLAGAILFLLDGASPLLRLGAGLAVFVLAAALTGLLPRVERDFLRDALRHGLRRSGPARAASGD